MSNTATATKLGPRRIKAASNLLEMAYCRLMLQQPKVKAAYLNGADLDVDGLDLQLEAAEQEIAELRALIARARKAAK